MVDLNLLSGEVEQDRTVGEPLVVLDVPDQPDMSQRTADERAELLAVACHDRGATVQPLRPVAFDPEVEHARILSESDITRLSRP